MKRNKSNLFILPGCTIEFERSSNYFVFTNENQKFGRVVVQEFPWKKKNIFEEAYQILANGHFGGNINTAKKAFKIISLKKHVYPEVIYKA